MSYKLKSMLKKLICLTFFFLPLSSNSFYTSVGLKYAYKKSAFDSNNKTEQQSTTGSISFYFIESIALELSYTNGLYVKTEKQPNTAGAFQRTTTVYSDIYGLDLIYLFATRKDRYQPYIKAGMAQVKRQQIVQDDNNTPWEIKYNGPSPSYGLGIKVYLTTVLAIDAGYDIIQTPVDQVSRIDEANGRLGLSWTF